MKYIMECKKSSIEVLLPNINKSDNTFIYDETGIYYPLLGINNVGEVVVRELLEERQKGEFKDFDDFVFRTKDILNKRQVNNLIYAGALDCFGLSRKSMVEEYDNVNQKMSYLQSLGSSIIKTEFSDDEYTFEEIAFYEKEALGFNLKFNQFVKYYPVKKQYNCNQLINSNLKNVNKAVVIFKFVRVINTKNNDKMAFVQMYDDSMEIEGVIFPTVYEKYSNIVMSNKVYLIAYKMENRNDKLQAIIDSIYNLN